MSRPAFTDRNVDFYSGIIMRALGIPVEMFTVMFAIGRMPGWIANYKEVMDEPTRIYRSERLLLQRHHHARAGHPGGDVHRDVRHRPHAGLDCELQGSHG